MGKLEFKIDVMEELRKKGYNPQRIRNEKLLSQSVLTYVRRGVVPVQSLVKLCELLERQPGSIIRYVPDDIPEKTE